MIRNKWGILVLLIGLFSLGCSSNESDENRYLAERMKLLNDRNKRLSRLGNDKVTNGLYEVYHKHLSRIGSMFQKVKYYELLSRPINFDSDYRYFSKDNSLNLEFWKFKGKLSEEEAFLILDNLMFEFEKSDYCNDWFRFYSVDVGFDSENNVYTTEKKDSVRFVIQAKTDNYIPIYYLDKNRKDSIFSNFLKLDVSKRGKQSLKGHLTVRKENRMEFVPFTYDYLVR